MKNKTKDRKYFYKNKAGKLSHTVNRNTIFITLLFVPVVLIISLIYIYYKDNDFFDIKSFINSINFLILLKASFLTFSRIIIAYVLSLITALALALIVTSNKTVERFLLPVFDVIESVPILAFFPLIIGTFLYVNFLEGAAIFIIYITMVWTLVFTMVGGIKLIPKDIKYAAQIYKIKSFDYVRHVLIPAITPEIVTGSILSFATAWDIIMVAEVLHVYIPNSDKSIDLLGLGSILVNSSNEGNHYMFLASTICMIFIITVVNIFVWQKLLNYSEKFRFD
ncbi:MAG: NitT/TauT family transport system permease protein [Patescibacteria group bacterium]|nr:NitT/TauT family transport system permease protein [Patescibacteria group bacterium]